MFRTVEYLRFINVLNGITSLVVCASYLIEPFNSVTIATSTTDTAIILKLHGNIYFFIGVFSLMAARINNDICRSTTTNAPMTAHATHAKLMFVNRLQIIHYSFLIASNGYLYYKSVMSTWTTLIMNVTVLIMFIAPMLPERTQASGTLTMGNENEENVF